MTDPNRPTPAPEGGTATGGPGARPATDEATAAHDPIAERSESGAFDAGHASADPDALDQSVGRDDGDQGDARTRDGAI
jgi:hypothetical protein